MVPACSLPFDFVDVHLSKLLLPRSPRDVLLPIQLQFLDTLLALILFPQNPNLLFRHIPLAFHVWGALQTSD